jgi:hypothetical protein
MSNFANKRSGKVYYKTSKVLKIDLWGRRKRSEAKIWDMIRLRERKRFPTSGNDRGGEKHLLLFLENFL